MHLSRRAVFVALATIAVGLPTAVALRHHSVPSTRADGTTAAAVSATSAPSPTQLATPSPPSTQLPTPAHSPLGAGTSRPPSRLSPPPAATPLGRTNLIDYRGLGTWVDAYDYSHELGGKVSPSVVDDMARQGVRTLYIQAAKESSKTPQLLVSPDLLAQFLIRAHADHLRVVAWYLPTLTDPDRDWAHVAAILNFRPDGQRFDGLGLDIEARDVSDVQTRNDRLIAFSRRVRSAVGADLAVSAIVLPPVVTDRINTSYWPDFPWHAIASSYDVWLPMAYWTNRTTASGYRDAFTYVHDNAALLRQDLGEPDAPVHVIGGIADKSTTADYQGMIRAAVAAHAIGDSSYDWATTSADGWATLRTSPS